MLAALYPNQNAVGLSFFAPLQSSLVPVSSIGDGTPTFTRATAATVWGYGPTAVLGADSPILLTVASGEARFVGARRIGANNWSATDANGVALTTSNGASSLYGDASGPLGYLAEAAATNLALQSQTFQTTWGLTAIRAFGSGSTVDAAVAPDGTSTADLITETNAAASVHTITQAFTDAASAYTFSVYYKPNGRTWFALTDGGAANYAYFNASGAGTVGTRGAGVASGAAKISALANGWYRASITYTGTGVGSLHGVYLSSADNTSSYDGDNTSGAYLWGAQLETGSIATSYIPTTTVAVARDKDALSFSPTGNALTAQGAFYIEAAQATPAAITGVIASINDGSVNNRVSPTFGIDGKGRLTVSSGGVTQADVQSIGNAAAANVVQRFAGYWSSAGANGFWNGIAGTMDSSVTPPASFSTIEIGAQVGAAQLNGTIRQVKIYDRPLSTGRLQALTQ